MNIWHPGSLCSVTAPPCSTNTTNPSTEIPPFLIINEDFWMHIHTYLHCGLIVANLGQNSVSPPFFLGWTSKTNFSHHEESLPMKKFTDQKKVDSRHSNPIGSNFSLPCTRVHAFLPCLQNCIYQKKKNDTEPSWGLFRPKQQVPNLIYWWKLPTHFQASKSLNVFFLYYFLLHNKYTYIHTRCFCTKTLPGFGHLVS